MSLAYIVREGLSGFARAKLAFVASISAMTVALALIGILILIGFQARQLSEWLTKRVGQIDVFLHHVDEPTGRTLRDRIVNLPGVESATYISKREAIRVFRREFGEGAETFLSDGGDFLPASVKVQVKPERTNPESLNRMIKTLRGQPHVDDVVYNSSALTAVQQNLSTLTWVGISLGLVILLAAVFLVANTIRLTIYARRLLIKTMKLVGATDSFIRKPFLVEGLVQGLLGGMVGAAFMGGMNALLLWFVPQLQNQPWPGGHPLVMVLALVGFGLVLGWLGSLFAIRKFVKSVTLN
ncbi:MAG TPA: ABC transporter permease [Rhodothermales bacterium]|nr:ABC transporter permease [Rhodothermales bacterium]